MCYFLDGVFRTITNLHTLLVLLSLLGGKINEDRYTSSKMKDQAQNIARGNEIEEKLRRRLAFHFMDPVEKFIARRQVPWKLLLQFLKGT